MDAPRIERVRAFSRLVAERTGTVTDRFLGRRRPMGESRVLWEIGHDGIEIRALRNRLGLDSGYASRVLRALVRQRLITLEASRADRRVRRVKLTKTGRAEIAELDRLADAIAWNILQPLDARERDRLIKAMDEVQRLLQASVVRIGADDPNGKDAQWCLARYFEELRARFDEGFDPVRDPVAEGELAPPRGAFVVARIGERPVGCAGLCFRGDAPPEIRRMWVDPQTRGAGIGKRLLEDVEQRARDAGATAVRLETNRALKEAIQLYRSRGYREVARFNELPYADYWFEKDLRRS